MISLSESCGPDADWKNETFCSRHGFRCESQRREKESEVGTLVCRCWMNLSNRSPTQISDHTERRPTLPAPTITLKPTRSRSRSRSPALSILLLFINAAHYRVCMWLYCCGFPLALFLNQSMERPVFLYRHREVRGQRQPCSSRTLQQGGLLVHSPWEEISLLWGTEIKTVCSATLWARHSSMFSSSDLWPPC